MINNQTLTVLPSKKWWRLSGMCPFSVGCLFRLLGTKITEFWLVLFCPDTLNAAQFKTMAVKGRGLQSRAPLIGWHDADSRTCLVQSGLRMRHRSLKEFCDWSVDPHWKLHLNWILLKSECYSFFFCLLFQFSFHRLKLFIEVLFFFFCQFCLRLYAMKTKNQRRRKKEMKVLSFLWFLIFFL